MKPKFGFSLCSVINSHGVRSFKILTCNTHYTTVSSTVKIQRLGKVSTGKQCIFFLNFKYTDAQEKYSLSDAKTSKSSKLFTFFRWALNVFLHEECLLLVVQGLATLLLSLPLIPFMLKKKKQGKNCRGLQAV